MRTRSDKKREDILTAAQQLFLQRGSYGGTSMDGVATAANVSKQTLYGYFKTKEELFLAVVKKHVGEPWKNELSLEVVNKLTTVSEFRTLLNQVLTMISHKLMNPEYVMLARIILAESSTQPKLAALYRQEIPERGMAAITAILKTAADKKLITVEPSIGTRMLIGCMLTYFLLDGILAHAPPKKPNSKQINAIVDEFIALITKS